MNLFYPWIHWENQLIRIIFIIYRLERESDEVAGLENPSNTSSSNQQEINSLLPSKDYGNWPKLSSSDMVPQLTSSNSSRLFEFLWINSFCFIFFD